MTWSTVCRYCGRLGHKTKCRHRQPKRRATCQLQLPLHPVTQRFVGLRLPKCVHRFARPDGHVTRPTSTDGHQRGSCFSRHGRTRRAKQVAGASCCPSITKEHARKHPSTRKTAAPAPVEDNKNNNTLSRRNITAATDAKAATHEARVVNAKLRPPMLRKQVLLVVSSPQSSCAKPKTPPSSATYSVAAHTRHALIQEAQGFAVGTNCNHSF